MEQVCTHLLYSEVTECELYKVCNRAKEDKLVTYTTNEDCLSKPWKMSKSEKLCPFGNIWYSWGLGRKEYEKET
jgi:hypothetical protein